MVLNFLSFSGYLLMAGGAVALVLEHTFWASHIGFFIIQISAIILMIWARLVFGKRSFHLTAKTTKGKLITNGPYKIIRHPIYAAICLFVLASLGNNFSWQTAFWVALVVLGSLIRIFCEEHILLDQYPDYRAYARKTKRLIPFLF